MMRPEDNPFYSHSYRGQPFFDNTVEDRLDRLPEFNADQCRAALQVRGLQPEVETALKRRLKILERQDEPSTV